MKQENMENDSNEVLKNKSVLIQITIDNFDKY